MEDIFEIGILKQEYPDKQDFKEFPRLSYLNSKVKIIDQNNTADNLLLYNKHLLSANQEPSSGQKCIMSQYLPLKHSPSSKWGRYINI